ncbi:MAG: STAS/SEC14 domain-containing protein [Bacteroidetes bacterium]|nr:STAS/SEC14 domain-containing protein [Bacteroidota bacterium]
MVTQIAGLAGNTVGFTLTGNITKEHYDTIIIPAIEQANGNGPHINLLLVINTDLSNFTMGAWMKDALVGLQNLTRFNKVAVVSDSHLVRNMTSMANMIVPGEYKYFLPTEENEAKVWVSESDGRI